MRNMTPEALVLLFQCRVVFKGYVQSICQQC